MFAYTPLLFLFGMAAGTAGTMVGVGMGFVHVPFLILLFGFSPQTAVATSIAIIFMNTLSGSLQYYHQGRLDISVASKLSLAMLPGAMIGPFIVESYSNDAFSLVFSGVLLVAAVNLMFGTPAALAAGAAGNSTVRVPRRRPAAPNMEVGVIGSLVIGFISNLLGVGGGIIHVPFLILVMRIPTHRAIGTAHLILCVSSFVGTVVFAFLGHVNIHFAVPIGIGAIIGASLGADLARRMQASTLRRVLALLVMFVGLTLVIQST
jgi:uncharacterized membrane protein YfcA